MSKTPWIPRPSPGVAPLVESGSAQHKALLVAYSAGLVGGGFNVAGGSRFKVSARACAAAMDKGLLAVDGRNTETGAPMYKLTDAGRAEARRLGAWVAS